MRSVELQSYFYYFQKCKLYTLYYYLYHTLRFYLSNIFNYYDIIVRYISKYRYNIFLELHLILLFFTHFLIHIPHKNISK